MGDGKTGKDGKTGRDGRESEDYFGGGVALAADDEGAGGGVRQALALEVEVFGGDIDLGIELIDGSRCPAIKSGGITCMPPQS